MPIRVSDSTVKRRSVADADWSLCTGTTCVVNRALAGTTATDVPLDAISSWVA